LALEAFLLEAFQCKFGLVVGNRLVDLRKGTFAYLFERGSNFLEAVQQGVRANDSEEFLEVFLAIHNNLENRGVLGQADNKLVLIIAHDFGLDDLDI
jgi:hypothetical protein